MGIEMGSIELLTGEEFVRKYGELTENRIFEGSFRNIRHCSAGVFGGCVAGTLFVPDKSDVMKPELSCGFYIDRQRLLIIDDDMKAVDLLSEIGNMTDFSQADPGRVLFELFEHLIKDDTVFLEKFERRLAELEDMISSNISAVPEDLDALIAAQRRELRHITVYYKLMSETADVIQAAMIKAGNEQNRELFVYFAGRVRRFYQDASEIAEHTLQIRDMYISKIDMQQNKVMRLLTIVTTIFMPLTLITGWYGMNFVFMPELSHRYGYIGVCVLAAMIVIMEIVLFKRKKWF